MLFTVIIVTAAIISYSSAPRLPTATPTYTLLPTLTLTSTPTRTPTPLPTSTLTPSPTTTPMPLSWDSPCSAPLGQRVKLSGRIDCPISISSDENGYYSLLLENPIPECKSRPPAGLLCRIALWMYPAQVNVLHWYEGGEIRIEVEDGGEAGGDTLVVVEGIMTGPYGIRPCGIRLERAYLP